MAEWHYILDVSVIIDMWLDPEIDTNTTTQLLDQAQEGHVTLWLCASSLPTLEYVTRRRLKTLGAQPEQARDIVRQLMAQLLKSVNISTVPGFEQHSLYLEARDVEDAQIAISARSLHGAQVAIVTLADTFDTLGECEAIAPKEALARLRKTPEADASPLAFIDLAAQQRRIRPELERRIESVLRHGQYIMGPEVRELEDRLADYVGVPHCITASSGTDTLLIAMMALGIGPGDEVITTPFTFIATGEMIALLGATPVFVDIDPRTYNIDPDQIEAAITPNTRAIMPVSLYGQCADLDAINAIAEKHGLPVIEDGAQSFGATYKGRRSCGLSTIGSTSFFPSKPLGGYGDGGALFTHDDHLAKAMREIRVHGQDRRYHHPRIGLNGRMDTLQAAIVLAKLDRFPQEVEARARLGERYNRLFQERLGDRVVVPHIAPHNTSVFAQYTLQVEHREAVQEALKARGTPTAVHYPVPLHHQPAFTTGQARCPAQGLPVSERISQRVISLPMHPMLGEGEQMRIVGTVEEACKLRSLEYCCR
ncbi:aminotransferase class I/II-fold pyridoxal phosphate-dependent enzyme [Ectothiorhodospira lacustris]|uniref:aminotransferase class I/II-fold pyridoxal phosphate-dependent enzyme n=1 Tax=Ectothiorhodospira lacustris TaxID=2899127 RepID=UPI003242A1F7